MGEVNYDQISISALLSYEKCPRDYENQYIHLRKKIGGKSGAKALGGQWHEWYNARLDPNFKFVEEEWAREKDKYLFHAMTCALEETMADAWLTRGGCWAAEVPFEVPLMHPKLGHRYVYSPDADTNIEMNLVGRIDAIWRDANGDDWIVEHKTTSDSNIQAGSNYWEERRASIQGGVYYYACACLGLKAKGVIYNVVRKPGLYLRKNEDLEEYSERCALEMATKPGEYFASQEVLFMDQEMVDAMTDVWEKMCLIEYSDRRKYWPRSFGACKKFNSKCQYYYVCRGLDRLQGDGYEDREGKGIPKHEVVRTSDAIRRIDGGWGTP